jgi:hypothetical protein
MVGSSWGGYRRNLIIELLRMKASTLDYFDNCKNGAERLV